MPDGLDGNPPVMPRAGYKSTSSQNIDHGYFPEHT